jgi:hypothetical protein
MIGSGFCGSAVQDFTKKGGEKQGEMVDGVHYTIGLEQNS